MVQRKRLSQLRTDSGFRLIRVFSAEHNAYRLRKHVERLHRLPSQLRWHKKMKTRLDRKTKRGSA
jgi:hypothetical protein